MTRPQLERRRRPAPSARRRRRCCSASLRRSLMRWRAIAAATSGCIGSPRVGMAATPTAGADSRFGVSAVTSVTEERV